jgi:hypothetical protein
VTAPASTARELALGERAIKAFYHPFAYAA